jgi:hypothetical protein
MDNAKQDQGAASEGTGASPCSAWKIDKLAFEGPKLPDRGYTVKAWYLHEPKGKAGVQIFKEGQLVRQFLWPAYKIWNVAAHFSDIVDGEVEESASGYKMAAWDGISGATVVMPNNSNNTT